MRSHEGDGGGAMADFTMRDPENWIVRHEEFFPTRDIAFEDITVKIQNRYDDLLRRGYGDYMRIPPESERYNHEAAEIDFGPYADGFPPR